METRVLFLFFASGFSALVYEIVWIKLFSLSFGNTIYAVSTVVAAFMLGLSSGGFLFGKIADRRGRDIRLFAAMEGGIGVLALLIALGFPLLDGAYVFLHHKFSLSPEGSTLLRFLTAFGVLLLPTTLMGGSLPVLSRCLIVNLEKTGTEISRLYGINTLGACLGCFFTGFYLIPTLGTLNTQYLALAVNLSVAGMAFYGAGDFALFVSTGNAEQAPTSPAPAKHTKRKKKKKEGKKITAPIQESGASAAKEILLLASCLAGFCGLAYEVLWTRAFSVIYKSTVYLFSDILTVLLLGIAVGSLLYKKFAEERGDSLRWFGLTQMAIGCCGLFSILIFFRIPGEVGEGGQWIGAATWGAYMINLFSLIFAVIIFPALLMGLAFPLINRAYISAIGEVGQRAGRIYGANVVGGIFGSVIAGFLFIPHVGLQWGICLTAFISLILGAVCVIKSDSKKGFGSLGFVLGLASLFLFLSTLMAGKDIGIGPAMGGDIIYHKEGAAGTVKVIREKGGRALFLSVNNYLLATTGDVAVRFGHIPLLLHPSPREVLTISLGAGITSGAAAAHHEIERIDCVEIVPEIEEAAAFFRKSNHDILSNPEFHLTIWDGRNFVRTTQKKYDVIISDLFQPDSSGVGNLYSAEHYRNCLRILKPGGLMAQWLPLYQLHPDDLKTVIATFSSVFPRTGLWFGDTNASKPTLMLAGSREELLLDPKRLSERMKARSVQKDLIEWDDPMSLLAFYVTDQDGIRDFLKNAKINTDAYPVIEYSAPRHIWTRPADAITNFTELSRLRTPFKGLSPALSPERRTAIVKRIKRYFESRTRLLQARVAHAEGDIGREIALYGKAESINPSDPYLGFAYFELGHLYLRRGRAGEALRFLEKASSIAPHLPEAHFFLSRLYKQKGEEAKANREYRLAMEALGQGSD